jgi:hypothetical protein
LKKIEELQSKLSQFAIHGPEGTESLAQGKDRFSIGFVYVHRTPRTGKGDRSYWTKVGEERANIDVTWDEVFAYLAPTFITPSRNYDFVHRLNNLIESHARPLVQERFPGDQFAEFRVFKEDYDIIKIQLRALGLIAATDIDSWVLTDCGDAYMNKLLAVHRRTQPHVRPDALKRAGQRECSASACRRKAKKFPGISSYPLVVSSVEVTMQTITITLSDDRLAQLQKLAVRFGVQPEDLVRVSVEELSARPEDAFQRAVQYVLEKNADLYRRLV